MAESQLQGQLKCLLVQKGFPDPSWTPPPCVSTALSCKLYIKKLRPAERSNYYIRVSLVVYRGQDHCLEECLICSRFSIKMLFTQLNSYYGPSKTVTFDICRHFLRATHGSEGFACLKESLTQP